MRVLIINTDYGVFLRGLYDAHPSLEQASYEEQLAVRNDSLFGVADFYSRAFIELGHDAWEVHANNAAIQVAWMKRHGLEPIYAQNRPRSRLGRVLDRVARRLAPRVAQRASPLRTAIGRTDLDLERTLVAQARVLRPDVVLNQSVSEVESHVLRRIRPFTRLIVGQIASPLPDEESYGAYDLMISSLPNFVEYFRKRGLPAELNRLAFQPSVLSRVGPLERDVPLSFVGSITPAHKARFDFLEYLADHSDIAIWGRVDVPDGSPILRRYRGEAWGRDMYSVLARSKITVNQHIDIAEGYANNLRLFEATGMGTLLITDWKSNITDMFDPGKEVVCYRDPQECLDLIRYYLDHESKRAAIAAAGQRRTLCDHTFCNRIEDLVRIFAKSLDRGSA